MWTRKEKLFKNLVYEKREIILENQYMKRVKKISVQGEKNLYKLQGKKDY